jgi:acetyltransferase
VADGADVLERAGIPTFGFPDHAARIFNYMWRYDANLLALFETPTALPDELAPDRAAVRALFAQARSEGRTVLNAAESARLLEAYEIPSVPTRVALHWPPRRACCCCDRPVTILRIANGGVEE